MSPTPCCLRPLLVGFLLVRGLLPAAAAPLVTQVAETGGLNEATDTITARFTGQTFTNGIVGEFFYPYAIPAFGEDVPAYVDRTHQWNGATPAGLPPYLAGGDYVLIGYDNRNQAGYTLEITVSEPATVYLLIDNRLGDGTPNNPPENGAPPGSWTRMTWVGTDGFVPVQTGANRAGDATIPDEVGLDEGGDGFGPGLSLQNWASVYARSVPAGPFQVRAMNDATRNMYGVVLTRQNHQVLTWVTPAPGTPLRVGQSYPLAVTASSGLPVNYAVVRGPATLANGAVTITGPGTIELAAEQAGDASHAPAGIRRLFNRPAAPLALAGQWPGVPRGNAAGVTIAGPYAYLAAGLGGLMTFDVANPQDPVHLGTYPTTAESWEVAVSDARAYLADGSAGLQIIDVTQPASPVRLGGFDTLGDARGVAVVGTRVYLADGSAGLQILDVSNPAAPVRLGGFDTPGFAESVVVAGHLAFVADTYTGMQIVDVTDPANPVFVGAFDTSGNTEAIAISGDLAYLADGFTGLQIFDVSNPAIPARLGIYNTPGSAVGVSVSGTLACVADDAAGLVLVDVSNPAAPAAIGPPFDTPGFARAVTLAGNLAYVADAAAGLRIVDLTQPTAPVALGSHATGGLARKVTLSGSLALVADAEAGLQIVDVSQPAQPVLLANFDTPGYAQNVAVSGSLAFVADGFSGLRVVDLGQPSHPVALGSLGLGGYTQDVTVQGNRAWAAAEAAGLKIIDLTDPANPALLGGYDTPGAARAVTVVGSLAYVADASAGLHIFDVGQPATPTLVGTIDTGRTAQDVAVSGAYAYVADWDGGLQIFDVSQPSKPVWVGAYDTPSSTERVVVSGHLAFLADTTGVLVVDVEDPTHPVPVGALETRGTALGIDVDDSSGLACVADREWGLQVMSWRAGIPQSIAFHPPPAVAPFGAPATLQASATGSLPVEFSVVSGPASLAGDQLSTTAFGTVILQASQAGDSQFLPATTRRSIHAGTLALRPGYLKFETWSGLSTFDNRLDTTLLADPRYPAEPDFASYTSAFTSRPVYPDDTHGGYGGRISGYLTPPETGEYRLFVQSDDTARLFLSTDDQPANLALVAEEPACCNAFGEPYSPRTSVPIHLEAGRSYYVEGIWKEGAGADYLRVAWRREGDPTPAASLPVIPASAIAAWVPDDDPAELFVSDPAGNLDGDPTRTSLDLIFVSLQSNSGRYRLVAETVAPFPAPADLGPDRRIDLVWLVDADRNLATGQSADGDDYHVRLYLDGSGWHWSWDKVSPVATGDGVANLPEDFELVVSGNRASLSFPAYYLPHPSFDVWAVASSLASPNWPPATAHPPTARGTFNLGDFRHLPARAGESLGALRRRLDPARLRRNPRPRHRDRSGVDTPSTTPRRPPSRSTPTAAVSTSPSRFPDRRPRPGDRDRPEGLRGQRPGQPDRAQHRPAVRGKLRRHHPPRQPGRNPGRAPWPGPIRPRPAGSSTTPDSWPRSSTPTPSPPIPTPTATGTPTSTG
jgi:hypothetical protein